MWRRIIQTAAIVVFNPWLSNFLRGRLYTGKLKKVCVPVLNCYSCPAATGACPIGALQESITTKPLNPIALHVVGLLGLVGVIAGRFPCGWLCPFGYLQDALHKIPSPKLRVPGLLEYGKYAALLVLVIALPVLLVDHTGYSTGPWFCKTLCPAGTMEGAIPLLIAHPDWVPNPPVFLSIKSAILVLFLAWMVLSPRPFCRVACPLGAIYGLFNRWSLLQLRVDAEKCIRCNRCQRVCPADLRAYESARSGACIRCLDCMAACPRDAISFGLGR